MTTLKIKQKCLCVYVCYDGWFQGFAILQVGLPVGSFWPYLKWGRALHVCDTTKSLLVTEELLPSDWLKAAINVFIYYFQI